MTTFYNTNSDEVRKLSDDTGLSFGVVHAWLERENTKDELFTATPLQLFKEFCAWEWGSTEHAYTFLSAIKGSGFSIDYDYDEIAESSVQLATEYSSMIHSAHKYGTEPYSVHLNSVRSILSEAGMNTVDDECIALLHDSIEDVSDILRDSTKQFIKSNFTSHVYNSVWACSGIGNNRAERNKDIYAKIRRYPQATNYKLADRNSNLTASRDNNNENKLNMYVLESDEFNKNVVSLATNEMLKAQYYQLIKKD